MLQPGHRLASVVIKSQNTTVVSTATAASVIRTPSSTVRTIVSSMTSARADVGFTTGRAAPPQCGYNIARLAQRWPDAHFMGLDLSPEHIKAAKAETERLSNVYLRAADFEALP